MCELLDMTCFASFRAQTIAEVLCNVILFFSRHFADDTGLMHFSVFFTLQMTWEFVFFCVCPATPMSSAGTI